MTIRFAVALAAVLVAPAAVNAYPGGTPDYQTDVAPYCADCHSSRDVESLAGNGEQAAKELAERKHVALILAGQKGYESLSESDRATLADQIRALDAASTVALEAPAAVGKGQTFQVTVSVTGGAGPVVGVALVDRAHRWYARPASSVGWQIAAPPAVIGPDGQPQTEWISKRPESADRNLSYVNVSDIASDVATGQWATATVVFALRAPDRPGDYPLVAAFLYGTEKSSILGYTTDALGQKGVRGGLGGGSGRILFTAAKQIQVQ
jgi:hypothetical protein